MNKEHKGILLSHLPTNRNLWAMFDIYGNTVSAKFVPAGKILFLLLINLKLKTAAQDYLAGLCVH